MNGFRTYLERSTAGGSSRQQCTPCYSWWVKAFSACLNKHKAFLVRLLWQHFCILGVALSNSLPDSSSGGLSIIHGLHTPVRQIQAGLWNPGYLVTVSPVSRLIYCKAFSRCVIYNLSKQMKIFKNKKTCLCPLLIRDWYALNSPWRSAHSSELHIEENYWQI